MTVQTHPQVTRDLRLAARQGLLPARGSGWLAGFGNMFAKELGEWFRTRRWLWQLLIWPASSLMASCCRYQALYYPTRTDCREQEGSHLKSETFCIISNIAVMAGTIGMIILAQDEIIQEKQSGTAAWILSKPAARQAFILTKLLSNTIGALVFIVALPGLITLGETYPGDPPAGAPAAFPGRSRGGPAVADLLLEPGDPAGRPVRVARAGAGDRLRSHVGRNVRCDKFFPQIWLCLAVEHGQNLP